MVLKCDTAGTEEAIGAGLAAIRQPGVEIAINQSGVGKISKSDILMALTGSRLVIGFNVDITPKLQQHSFHTSVTTKFLTGGIDEDQFCLHDSRQQD